MQYKNLYGIIYQTWIRPHQNMVSEEIVIPITSSGARMQRNWEQVYYINQESIDTDRIKSHTYFKIQDLTPICICVRLPNLW